MIPRGAVVSAAYVPPKKGRRMPGSSSVTNGSIFRKRNRNNVSTPSEDDSIRTDTQSSQAHSLADSTATTVTRPSTSKSRSRRDSSISSLSELRSNIRRRSASLRGPVSPKADNLASTRSKDSQVLTSTSSRSTIATRQPPSASSENLHDPQIRSPSAASVRPTRTFAPTLDPKKDELSRPSTALQGGYGQMADANGMSIQSSGLAAAHTPTLTYQKIHDMASKRISTLDYLRKTHEHRVYWYNTLLVTKADLLKMPYFDLNKLSRRAANYLLLGLSIPAVLDPNATTIHDYLRTFVALLAEFETYQTAHPPDGPSHSSLSRMRVPGMFKRVPQITNPKNRRGSAADSFLAGSNNDHLDHRSFSSGHISMGSTVSLASLAGSERDLFAGEEYQYLLTPSVPFDPDYFETFATLCDVFIDCYTNIIELVSSPETCGPSVGDMFAKADHKIRKIMIAGIVRDFEDATKQGVRAEMASVGKVVLGGLM